MGLKKIIVTGFLLTGLAGIFGCWDSENDEKKKKEFPNPRYIQNNLFLDEQKVYKIK